EVATAIYRESAAIENRVFFNVVIVYSRGAISLNALLKAKEDNIISDLLDTWCRVLSVNTMSVAAVWALPAVVVDQVAVGLSVGGLFPEADSLVGVVDDKVGEL